MQPKTDYTRKIIAGAFADFIAYLDTLANPIVVGGGYPRKRLIDAFNNWAENNQFNVSDGDIKTWQAICKQDKLRGSING